MILKVVSFDEDTAITTWEDGVLFAKCYYDPDVGDNVLEYFKQDGSIPLIVGDKRIYLCNDNGQTIEKITGLKIVEPKSKKPVDKSV